MALTVVASPRFADHLTPPGHPERVERHVVMQVVAGEFRERGGTVLEPRAATNDELARVHDADYITLIRETAGRATALDPDTFTSPETYDVACLAAGAVADRRRSCSRWRRRLPGAGAGETAWPPCGAQPGDGILSFQQRRGCRRARPRPRSGASGDRRLRRAPRQRHTVELLRRSVGALRVVAPVPVLSGHRRRRRDRDRRWHGVHREPSACGGRDRRRLRARLRRDCVADSESVQPSS